MDEVNQDINILFDTLDITEKIEHNVRHNAPHYISHYCYDVFYSLLNSIAGINLHLIRLNKFIDMRCYMLYNTKTCENFGNYIISNYPYLETIVIDAYNLALSDAF
jgi:hypothetical protein